MANQQPTAKSAEAAQDSPTRLPSFWSLRRFLPVGVLICLGVTFFITLFYLVRVYEKERKRDVFTRVAEARINAFMRRKDSDLEALMSVGHFFASSRAVNAKEFKVFVQGPLQWHPEIQSLSWIRKVAARERDEFEAAYAMPILERSSAGPLVEAQNRAFYFPVVYHESLGAQEAVQGWDIGSNPICREAMETALRAANGRMISSAKVLLASKVPGHPPETGIHVLLPIYVRSIDPKVALYDATNLVGFLGAVLRPSGMLRQSTGARSIDNLDVSLFDQSTPGGPTLLDYQTPQRGAGPASTPTWPKVGETIEGFYETATVEMAGRTWTILCQPAPEFSQGVDWEGWTVLLGGLLLTGFLGSYLYTLLGQNAYIENVVTRRTRELASMNVRLQNEIGERERGERALRDSEALYHSLVDTVPLNIIRKNNRGEIIFGNKRYCETIGKPLESLLGKTDFDLFPKALAEKYVADDLRVVQTGEIFEDVEEHRKADGAMGYVQVLKAPVMDAAGKIVGAQVIFWDVTEKKRGEEALKQTLADLARSNRDLEQFAYVASHDLQEPLRMIASYTQLLGKRFKDQLQGEAREFIEYAVEGAVRMQLLINDLLSYSRLDTRGAPLVPVSCNEVLPAALANLQIAIDESCALITHDTLPTVHADSIQLIQLFQNLLSNAIKFRGQDSPKIHISAAPKDRDWVFRVRDNGIGIDPKHAERIFVIFQRLHTREKYPGTGIGLAICKKIVERHGGRIWVETIGGPGATFCFTLPMIRVD